MGQEQDTGTGNGYGKQIWEKETGIVQNLHRQRRIKTLGYLFHEGTHSSLILFTSRTKKNEGRRL